MGASARSIETGTKCNAAASLGRVITRRTKARKQKTIAVEWNTDHSAEAVQQLQSCTTATTYRRPQQHPKGRRRQEETVMVPSQRRIRLFFHQIKLEPLGLYPDDNTEGVRKRISAQG